MISYQYAWFVYVEDKWSYMANLPHLSILDFREKVVGEPMKSTERRPQWPCQSLVDLQKSIEKVALEDESLNRLSTVPKS